MMEDPSYVDINIFVHWLGKGSKLSKTAYEWIRKIEDSRVLDLMEKYSLDYEDSLHLNVAKRTGTKEIVSNDKDFDRTPLKRTI